MSKTFAKIIVGAFALACSVQTANAQKKLFTNGNESGVAIYWRIPSIVRMNDGALWAFTDKRYNEGTDLGGAGGDKEHKIEISGRKSADNGASWDNSAVVLQSNLNISDDKEYLYAFGDAGTVVDRESGKVLMMTASGKKGVGSTTAGRPFVTRSLFENNAWTTTNVSDQFYGTNNAYGTHLFVTSGRIIQSTIYKKGTFYRLYAGVCLFSKNASYVVYSDDFGLTWHYLGGDKHVPVPDGDECKVEELPNGDILLQTRRRAGGTGRYFNVFSFSNVAKAEGTWQASAVTSGASDVSGQTYASQCNGELMLVPAKRTADSKQTYLVLLSVPASNDRSNICIYWKELPAAYSNPSNYVDGWNKYACSTSFRAYTTMALDKEGNIALLAEGGGIWFQSLSVATITGNAYTYSPSASGTYHTTGEPTFEHGVGGVVKPTLSVYGGTFTASQTITLNAPVETKIFYTLDGSDPQPFVASQAKAAATRRAATTPNSTKLYGDPITISEGVTTLKALAVDNNGNKSQTVATTYRVAAKTDDNTTTTDNTNKSKTGTMITLDHDNSKALYTNAGMGYTNFAFLRHNSTHIQMMSSTSPDLKEGQQLFNDFENNIQWKSTTENNKTTWKLELTNGREENNWNHITRYSHYAIIAPKGYRFLRYEIVMTSGSEEGAKLEEYTYKTGSSSEIEMVGSQASATASSTKDVTLERTLAQPTNVLYFRQDGLTEGSQEPIYVKSIKLVYAIDNAFDEKLPNENGTGFHSGFVDFGPAWQQDTNRNYGFSNSAPTDLETVNVKMLDGSTPQTVTVDGNKYFLAATNGDYYLEAPKKFRIVGATATFMRHAVTSSSNYSPSPSSNGEQIYFQAKDGTQNYLKIDDSGNAVNVTSLDQATLFTIKYQAGSGENHWSLKLPNGKYLTIASGSGNGKITATDTEALWAYDNVGLKSNATGNYIYLGNNADGHYTWDPRYRQDLTPTVKSLTTTPASSFTATVFNPEDTGPAPDGVKTLDTETNASVTVDNLNNDAVHINFDIKDVNSGGTALFNVQLKMIALNPEVETVEAAALPNGTGEATGNSPVTSENYIFNHGNTINVPVADGTTNATMVFRNAKNEEVTNWYKTGYNENGANETGSYSNVYLIGSAADATNGATNGLKLSSPVTGARTSVDKIGSRKIEATNIADVAKQTNTERKTLQDNKVDATTAGYQTVTMTVGDTKEPGTYYLYSADKPTNEIMPQNITVGQHVDFRFYTIKVKPVVAEKPKIEIVPLYSSTMKGEQHKKSVTQSDGTKIGIASDGSTLNTSDKYVGIKVTAQLNDGVSSGTVTGYLTAEAIENAMKTELENSAYKSPHDNDPLRNVLYVDMSDLKTVTTGSATTMEAYANATADNCLFFMPQGFAATNMSNTIAKQTDGTYKAIGDITVYDQQPFFSPYAFTTGQFKASYTRETTVNAQVAQVRNMAVVLPFDITLDPEGHPYLSGATEATKRITYWNITNSGIRTAYDEKDRNHDFAYAVVAEKVTAQKAEANQPYYVDIDKNGDLGFQFFIPNASFKATPEVPNDKENANQKPANPDNLQYKKDSGTWTAHGTYNGVAPAVDAKLWYFSKDYFWKSSQLEPYFHVVNVRPFRAYFTTTQQTGSNAKAGVVYSLDDIITTGIGVINVTPEDGKIYTLDGRYVGNSLENLAPNIYIRNGRKIIKR